MTISTREFEIKDCHVKVVMYDDETPPDHSNLNPCCVCNRGHTPTLISRENEYRKFYHHICQRCTDKYDLAHDDLEKRKAGLSIMKIKGLI